MSERPNSDWLGKRFQDRYEIRQELGKAIGRRTLLADDLQSQNPVVIKVVTFGNDFEWADLRLFEREGEVLKSLNHAAIPSYLDYFELDLPQTRGYALVQSYVEGRSLQEHLQAGRSFNEADVIDIAQRLLEILQYLHSQTPPIIHRDLKPSNILLSDRSAHCQGQLYLVDFGSVQAPFLHPTGTLTIVGTYGYMPPEQFGGRAEPASDLYSLGATLIYLVTGCHPADLPQQNLRIRFEAKATHITQPLRQWLRWLITPDISQRPESATEALKGLKTLLDADNRHDLAPRHLNPSRILVNQREDSLDIILPPKGFRPKQLKSWLNLLALGIVFSIASSIGGIITWIPLAFVGYMGFWFAAVPIMWTVSSIASFTAGFIAIIVIPTPASNTLLRQLHIHLNDQALTIYRESSILMRFRQILFSIKREEIERLELGPDHNYLEICGLQRRHLFIRQNLGLTVTEFKWFAQELSDNLGIRLTLIE